jgi:CBS domain-containing protein
LSSRGVTVSIESLEKYEAEPAENALLLKDFVLDKKVLDVTNREVDVVYDVGLVRKNGRLYVGFVDFSKHRFLRRMGLGFLANFIYSPEEAREHEVPWTYVQPLEGIGSFKGDIKLSVLKERLSELKPVDVADVLEQMDHDQRVTLFDQLDTHRASDILEEINPNVQRALIASLQKEKVVQLLDVMTPGQAADILSVLPVPEKEEILLSLDRRNGAKIRSILEQHNQSITNYSTHNYLAAGQQETVEEVLGKYLQMAKGKDEIMYLYVLDEQGKLLGVIDIKELLQGNRKSKLEEIMVRNVISLNPMNTLKDASVMFSRYNFRALPVVDGDHRLTGVVPYRDVMNLEHLFID